MYLATASQPLTRETFCYREHLVGRGLSASTINVQLSAIRKLVEEARRQGIVESETAASLTDVPNIKQQGTRQATGSPAPRRRNCSTYRIARG